MKNEFNKNKNNNKSSYIVQNTKTFDGSFLREKLIINKFKTFFILQVISIIQFIVGLSAIVASGIYLSQFLSLVQKYKSQSSQFEGIKNSDPSLYNEYLKDYHWAQGFGVSICAAFLAIGLIILIENFILVPVWCYSITKSQKQNFDFILKKANSTYLKANVRLFLTTDSTFNLVWYCTWFAFISVPYNIYQGLKYTYEHTKSNPNLKTNNNKINNNTTTSSNDKNNSSTDESVKDEDEKK